MPKDLASYKQEIIDDVAKCIEDKGCQPIVFVGSGFSMRYFGAPNWEQLLTQMANDCPLIDRDFAYYKQSIGNNIDIGSRFARYYHEWAWSGGKSQFDPSLFSSTKHPDVYLKNKVCDFIESLCPLSLDEITDEDLRAELQLFELIKPHSIVTTNYDKFLEIVFPDYTPILGQNVLESNSFSIGEIFKIHGGTSDKENIVLTKNDYDVFIQKKKYISAKLLTYFVEHPLLFVGYGAQDPNIISILSDIDEALSINGRIVDNIYMLNWDKEQSDSDYPAQEKVLSLSDGKSLRIKSITAKDFGWVFHAFATDNAMKSVNIKTLRAIMARTYDMVRYDIPRKTVDVDFDTLGSVLESDESVAKLFGITTLSNSTSVNAHHKYILTEVANELGYVKWNAANSIIEEIRLSTGIDIKSSDNQYHIKVKTGKKGFTHKYSQEAVSLLDSHRKGLPYKVDM